MNKQRILKQTTRLAVCLSLLLAAGCSSSDEELTKERIHVGELVDVQSPERSWSGQYWSRVQTTTGVYYIYTIAHGEYGAEVTIRTFESGRYLCIDGNGQCWRIIGS